MIATRLLKLADHLDAGRPGGHTYFNFLKISNSTTAHCGSAGCALGELPIVFRRYWKFVSDTWSNVRLRKSKFKPNDTINTSFGHAAEFFDISNEDAKALFAPFSFRYWVTKPKWLTEHATPKQVAKSIRKFVEYHQKNDRK